MSIKERSFNCLRCGVVFKSTARKGRKFCSARCQGMSHSEKMRGSSNPNFNEDSDYKYKCKNCGSEFISYSKNPVFCSRHCSATSEDGKIRTQKASEGFRLAVENGTLKRTAKNTSRIVKYKRGSKKKPNLRKGISRRGKHRYSNKKFKHWLAKKIGSLSVFNRCVVCKKFHKRKSIYTGARTCSPYCFSTQKSISQQGSLSHRWQGGKTSPEMVIRNSIEYKRWRHAVIDANGYSCRSCGTSEGVLHVHHIKSFKLFPELRLDVGNGEVLCFDCHLKTDTFLKGPCKK